ncbi:Peroxiredoxin [Neolewinella agarilytica]|uniref:Peroxiredoxin n=2 Tax=Neolewinella agarilytica TaxID=478744 RepID=A0A1H9HRX3_9BACT|nr:Peroxiredoxin [Neolewinella agarilytica]
MPQSRTLKGVGYSASGYGPTPSRSLTITQCFKTSKVLSTKRSGGLSSFEGLDLAWALSDIELIEAFILRTLRAGYQFSPFRTFAPQLKIMRFYALLLPILLLLACGDTGGTVSASSGASTAPASAPGSANLESPNIRVEVAGAPLPGALLIGQLMEQQYRVDTARIDGNAIVFQRSEPYPQGHYYAYFSDGSGVQMLITEDQTFTMTASMPDAVGTMVVKGSQDNELLYEALRYENSQQDQFRNLGAQLRSASKGSPDYDRLQAERRALVDQRMAHLEGLYKQAPNSLFTSFKRGGQNPQLRDIRRPDGQVDEEGQVVAFRRDFWNGVNFNDDRLLRTPVIFNKLKRYIKELTPQNADSIKAASDFLIAKAIDKPDFFKFFANWITLQYEPGKSTVMDAEAIHVHMIQNYFTRERAFWSDSMTVFGLQQRADQMAYSLKGQAGPDITVPGLDGKGKRLYDLKKPYIAVFMYNPECDHCIEQTPKLTQAYQSLKNDLDVYAIALDTDAAKWKGFVQAYRLQPFTNVFDPTNRSIFKTYYVDNTPELYLLGPDRKIVAKNLKVEQLAQAIQMHKSR